MKFSLIFDNSGDSIEFDVVNNGDILEYFVSKANEKSCNSFTDDRCVVQSVDRLVSSLHNSLSLTNSVMCNLTDERFPENENLLDYLDQQFLNRQHEQWVFSQNHEIDIDSLRFSSNKQKSKVGWTLHDLYPDDIRKVKLAEAMTKLGFIFHYEEVNMTVHRLEKFFSQDIEYKSDAKWQVFENPFKSTMVSNPDKVNFSFGYTYVGRQSLDKWQYWDTNLDCKDHYNYETLEYAFQMNLDRPQTIPFSPEFLAWCTKNQVSPVSRQIPIANAIDIDRNLKHYRTMLYKNSKAGNRARISIH